MRGTAEQAAATEALRALPGVAAARFRVVPDGEGWPIIPGRAGRIEYHDGPDLAVFTDRPRFFVRLRAVPGMRRHQTGDTEARMLFPPAAVPVVARIIGARRRRPPTPGRSAAVMATLRATSRAQKAPISTGGAP